MAQKKRRSRQKRVSRVRKFAFKLNQNLPRSEQWFQELWKPYKATSKLSAYCDKYNEQYGPFIGDVVNRGYKYIIEIDGSWHNKPEAKYRDQQKTKYLEDHGYLVVRIKAYNQEDFERAKALILARRIERKFP